MTPSQRTLAYLKGEGFTVARAERYVRPNPYSTIGHRRDLFGIIDYIGIRPGELVGVQSCGTAFAAHHRKILGPHCRVARLWLDSGSGLWLVGWRELKSGWSPRIHVYTPEDFDDGST